jgi:mRNA interferase RelE/StbE
MSRWRVEFVGKSEIDLSRLDRVVRRRIIDRLEWLMMHFNEITPLSLVSEWKGFFKIRIGDWRVIYSINWEKEVIAIHYIDHRTKVYKRRR